MNDSSKAGPQAIPTRYAGYHFRSRLEARWAVFFDALKLEWQYEPEGFDLPSGWYLPDFRVHLYRLGEVWIEVKGNAATAVEWQLLRELRDSTSLRAFMFGPIPKEAVTEKTHQGCPSCLCNNDGRAGMKIQIDPLDLIARRVSENVVLVLDLDLSELQIALDAARSARFEHGHSGAS